MDNGKRRKIVFDYLKLAEKIDEQGIEKTTDRMSLYDSNEKISYGQMLMEID